VRRVLVAVVAAVGLMTALVNSATAQPIPLSSLYTRSYAWWQDQPPFGSSRPAAMCVLTRVGGRSAPPNALRVPLVVVIPEQADHDGESHVRRAEWGRTGRRAGSRTRTLPYVLEGGATDVAPV
jgi:hypothetical protein